MSEASHSPSEESRPGGPGVGQHGAPGHPAPGERHRNEAVLGPFTVRDLTLLGGVLITFVGSLLPLLQRNVLLNLWNAQNIFFLAIGFLLPAAAAGLFIWRRFEPRRSLRVGSLSVDQFASVVAVLSCSYYFVFTVTTFTPGAVVGLLGGIALVAATTAARVIPPFAGDFDGRAATPAHIVARDAVRPVHRPAGADAHGADRAHDRGLGKVGAAAGPVREDHAGDTSAEDERSAAWFGAGWAASAAGAGAAAGAGVAGAGVRESGAPNGAGAGEGRAFPPQGVGTAEAGRASGPAQATPTSERAAPAGAAPAGSTRAASAQAGSPVAGPSADDVARPDLARDLGAPAARGAEHPVDVEARGATAAGPAGRGTESAGTAAGMGAAAGTGAAPGAGIAAAPQAPRAAETAGPAGAATRAEAGGPARRGAEDTGPKSAMPAGAAQAEAERENGRQFLDQLGEEPAPAAGPAGTGHEPAGAHEQGSAETAPYEPRAAEHAAGAPTAGGREPEPLLEDGYGQADGEAYGAPETSAPATAVFPSAGSAGAGAGAAGTESIGASRPFDEPAQHYEAFWFAVSQPRTAVDPMTGEPLFILEPGQWILALQDRGHEFVVQNTDGRVGVLRELSGIERG